MLPHRYSVAAFMTDTRRLLESGEDLAEVKAAIGELLVRLSQRDDLTRRATHLGPSDASDDGYLLWRAPPHFTLVLEQGTSTSLPAAPRSIHAHNNLYAGDSLELIFSAAKPVPPSWFDVSTLLVGDYLPPLVDAVDGREPAEARS